MAKKKSNINKYINGLEINKIYSKISRGSSFIPGVIDESKLTSRIVKKDGTFKAKPFAKSYKSIRPVLSAGFSSRGNFRTNYTPPPPFDTDASAFFTAVEDAGGTLTDNVKAEFDAFVVREKDADRWSKLKRLYPYLGGKIDSAVIDAVTLNSATNTNFVDADVDATIGLQGDGSTKYLKESENIDAILVSNSKFQVGVFFDSLNLTGVNQSFFGVQGTSPSYILWNRIFSAGTPLYYAGTTAAFTSPSFSATSSTIARYSNTSAYSLANSVEGTHQTADVSAFSLPSHRLGWFTSLVNSVAPNYYLNNKLSGGYIAEFDNLTETKDFESSYKTFINNIQAYAAAQAYFAAVETSSGTLTTNVKSEFSAFVSREVEAGRWSKIKRLYPYLGGKIDSAVIDAVTLNSATNTNFVDADVDATIGLQGDGLSKILIDTTPALLFADDNDWQFYYYSITPESGDKQPWGCIDSGNDMISIRRRNSVGTYVYGNNVSISALVSSAPTQESCYGGRFTQTDLSLYINSSATTATNTTSNTFSLPPNFGIGILGRNGSAPNQQFSDEKSGCMMFAEGMSKSEMHSFDSSYKTFINNITA